ncbi:beta strand repeat-containing protein, partial [Trinickia symbiotica]
LDTDNTAFMNGGPLTFSGNSDAEVVNLGKIGSSGGDVVLIASKGVTNVGGISAPQGSAELAVGQQVLLQDSSSSRQVFVQAGSGGTVLNQGAIYAAQVSLQAADGNVFALTGNHEAIRATGTGTRDGHIWLVAETGSVTLSGPTSAKNVDGSGGTVDTNAGNMVFQYMPTVLAGVWNITTPTIKIDNFAAISLSRSLNAGTSVNLQTTGASGQTGDINVASNIGWSGAASLSLGAYHTVNVIKGITIKNQGSGNLTLRADATGIDNGGSVLNYGTVDWSNSTGTVSLLHDMNGSYAPGTLRSNTTWITPTYSGLVTQITGYELVNSLADLKNVATDLAGNYALGRDIDASATSDGSYIPLGGGNTSFTGQFDGQGHTISSLTMQGTGSQTVAMFASLGKNAVVRDLNVNGSATSLDTNNSRHGIVGILAGENDGTIVRVNTSGNVREQVYYFGGTTAGGLVGVNHGTILRSSSSAGTQAGGPAGGLVGENDGTIAQSYASGPVSEVGGVLGSVAGSPGGLVGTNSGTITQSYATGTVGEACGTYGCITGAALVYTNSGTISQSFATGAVSSSGIQGQPAATPYGIAVQNQGKIASDVYWNKDTTTATIGVGYGTAIPSANGLTTEQMTAPASFSGWDFSSTGAWAMPTGYSHPVLRWQLEP